MNATKATLTKILTFILVAYAANRFNLGPRFAPWDYDVSGRTFAHKMNDWNSDHLPANWQAARDEWLGGHARNYLFNTAYAVLVFMGCYFYWTRSGLTQSGLTRFGMGQTAR